MNNNDESKLMKKIIKKDFNKLGVTLLMQALIMNIVIFVGCIGAATMQVLKEPNVNESELMESINKFCFSGTTMIIAVVIAFITIIIYRRKKLFQYDIRLQNKQFNLNVAIKAFIILFSVKFSGFFSLLISVVVASASILSTNSKLVILSLKFSFLIFL